MKVGKKVKLTENFLNEIKDDEKFIYDYIKSSEPDFYIKSFEKYVDDYVYDLEVVTDSDLKFSLTLNEVYGHNIIF